MERAETYGGQRMDPPDRIDAVEREAAAFTTALRAGSLGATVPTCPDWSLRDLATHVGGFTGFWTHVLCEGRGVEKTPAPEPPDGPLADWFADLSAHLVAMLRATPADTEVWTWADDDHTARFVGRRVAHELAIHRFDAQLAVGEPQPIEPDLAADGIEEIFFMIANGFDDARNRGLGRGKGQTLHLHDTAGAGEWTITIGPAGLDIAREHGDAELTLSGSTSDLELLLYQRPPLADVERIGDPAVLDAWSRTFTFG